MEGEKMESERKKGGKQGRAKMKKQGRAKMKWIDIKKNFEDQWVLLEVKSVDENFNVLEGEVLAHSEDKNEIYQKLLQIKPKEFSIEYTGELPEDLAVVVAA